ncbi:uncharacterized protein WM277_010281 [Molossus nigricans]
MGFESNLAPECRAVPEFLMGEFPNRHWCSRLSLDRANGALTYPWTSKRNIDLGENTVTHLFLFLPECPYPLLGRDLLQRSFNCWPLPLQARPHIKFHKTLAFNPASLPPDDDPEKPLQDCLEATDTADGRPDLRDDPLPSSDEVLFIDGSNYVQEDISSYRPCSLPRRPSINTSAMPCLCPPQTLCTLSSQGLDANKEIHHPRTNSGLEGTIHCHPAFTNGYQGQRHPGLAASFLIEGRKSRMNGADLSRSLKMRLLRLSGL